VFSNFSILGSPSDPFSADDHDQAINDFREWLNLLIDGLVCDRIYHTSPLVGAGDIFCDDR